MPAARLGPRLRHLVLVAMLLLVWITLHAFQGLGGAASIELSSGNEAATYLSLFALAAAALALTWRQCGLAARALATRPMLALGGWLLVTSVVSDDPGTSLRRLALFAMVFVLAGSIMLLAETQVQLARLLAIATAVVLLLSYGGVLLTPELAVHQVTDAGEPGLAGDWRGVFGHKNDAAAVFSLFVFVGFFVARCGFAPAGLAIVGLSLVFMLFAGGKSALGLAGLAMAVAAFWQWRNGGWLRIVLALAPIVVINLLGVGSVLFPGIAALTHALPVDPTFTGRTEIWSFAIDALQGHLLTGHGFDAFWNTAGTRFGGEQQDWAGTASHAHNGYLDMVVGTGLPGLGLALLVFVAQPMRDLLAAERRGTDPALLALLLRIWLFGLYLCGMESILFLRSDPVWVTFLFAVCGLRYAARYRLRRGDPA